jgi:DNA-binding LacI/PurR family transcriptional regulator
MGSTPPRAVLFIASPLNLSVAVYSTVQNASMTLSRETHEKIKAEFLPTGYSYDLNLCFGR